ncbi:cupin domain-containing protein [Rhizobium laguerreae]|uniref:Mannose-6-phosphate isomerase-like protein (Cupin superfamily) n=1 Tax=Rhizobium laguerreae TaxID=1076926 RepID=A0ABR6G8N1_9HYPH|nr:MULTISPECIES: cupin domain-containing protein [Rhizobium]AHF82342.1 cupin [Rhizobium leguminosarum bv. trifolii WSM1689]MBB3162256.1 mannose-6-phosphate isomerase-like protein (cupin superfamily) [Rhizobium laguerreae]MBY3070249.1 cupin domain-containing protein [Rhizobium laguerreae]MBY3138286.1 cupin domain-containing protein [Rhizobium laguerreae]MBY3202064.1 cupin domain-containing protein [Rhizobium laguerreae]
MGFNTGTIETEYAEVTEHWSPRVIADLNGQSVKLAKVQGQLAWHSHRDEDELFLIWKGALTIEYRDRPHVHLKAGDFHVVPRGVEHNPVAEEECWIVLSEPSQTKHTGDVVTEKTKTLDAQRSHLPA